MLRCQLQEDFPFCVWICGIVMFGEGGQSVFRVLIWQYPVLPAQSVDCLLSLLLPGRSLGWLWTYS